MRRIAAVLVAFLTLGIFMACAGCAGIYIRPDGGMVGLALGDAEASVEKLGEMESLCLPQPEAELVSTYRPVVTAVATPLARIVPAAPPVRSGAACDLATMNGYRVTVRGGNLGAGWFGVLTGLVLGYFGMPVLQ
jgi:hypothetical protein